MENAKKICLATVQETDRRYSAGHKYRAFVKKSAFLEYLDKFPEMLYSDEVLVILQGGPGQTITTAAAAARPWIMEE